MCKSILGLWYFQGYMFQPGIYGIIKWLFFCVKLTPNRYILHVLEGYRVISIPMWLFRGLHKVTILHVVKEPKNCTESAFENSSISCIVKTMQGSGVWRHFGDHLIISVSDYSLRPSWIFPKRSANDFGWNLLHVRLKKLKWTQTNKRCLAFQLTSALLIQLYISHLNFSNFSH